MQTGAVFDSTGNYRYSLWRKWGDTSKLVFVMLNPSTADAQTNDATIRRCIQFAQSWGYGALEVVNLFALVATHPRVLRDAIEPVGAECNRYLIAATRQADGVVVGWGNWGRLRDRDRAVLKLLASEKPLYCLGINQSGQPRHPLYVKGDTSLIPYWASVASSKTQSCIREFT
jgi:hypothetical protein